MKAFIRKSVASIFLLLSLWPLLTAFYFTIKETVIRHRMEKMLQSHVLQTVSVPEKEVIWMDDHEIWVNESMFDIRTKKLENGIYTFTGMYDADETLLVKQHQKSTKKQTGEERMLIQLLQCLRQLYTEPEDESFIGTLTAVDLHSFIYLGKTQFTPPILTPPPKMGSSVI